ncbi:MAG: ABC transporter ATP-binding protein [Bacteroidales bacterium]|jgi:peptide/nickel transport system ATP-binding protein|nr:ABC transporter ATP-binding protein [Bacteroidales bacterium]
MNILEINNFSLDLRNDEQWHHILHHITIEVPRGKTVGIVGESGSGKSVTALSVMRLLSAKGMRVGEGSITFYDAKKEQPVDLLSLSDKELRKVRGARIAMIFQEPMTSLNPVIRCGDQIMEALQLHTTLTKAEAKERVLELFREVMLPRPEKIFSAYPHELSGGQKQRVMIAMALSCEPDILIADEPTTALDVTVQKGILELIKKMQKKYDLSVIFITHDLGVVAQIADEVAVLFHGDVVEHGPVMEIFNHPKHPYTQGLIACRPPLDHRPRRLPTVSDYVNAAEDARPDTLPAFADISEAERAERHRQLYQGEPLIRLEHLSKRYALRKEKLFAKREYVYALKDVSLDIYEGETLGLVGESGCGKTTLGRTLLRLIEPDEGRIFYRGTELTNLPQRKMRHYRKDLQIILQDPYSSLNQRLTVGDMITEPMTFHHLYANNKERRDRAIELLQRVGLEPDHFYRYPHEFSGGQRQRISIARALAVNPRFIICDESVSALDVSVQAQVLNLLNELKQEFKLTYIFISHDLSVVKYMSDRMAVMQFGEIVEMGEADSIYHHPQTEYTQTLIDSIPTI